MSVARNGALPVLRQTTTRKETRVVLLQRLPIYLACTLLALCSNYYAGKEMAWDSIDYHIYSGFSALHDRFGLDYFAAGPQSYFNPYAYAPFYALIGAGLPALLVASILAIAHSLILWVSFELGVLACPAADQRTRLACGACAAALAFLNPILVQQIGSSFADITTGTLILAGWLLLARAIHAPHPRAVALAGLLVGAAVALKPTNTVHALAAFALLPMLPMSRGARLNSALRFSLGLVVAFALVSAPWSYRLERTFGNPFFPLMNSVFRSPEFTVESLRHFRFIPSDLGEALWRPFAMGFPGALVHEELSAPDLRYAVLLLMAVACAIAWSRRRLAAAGGRPARDPSPVVPQRRVLRALAVAFALDWVLWLTASGNSRYFLPMACVAAVLVAALVFDLLARWPKARGYLLVALLLAQAVQLAEGADLRWRAAPWEGPWLAVSLPPQLATQSELYLSIGAQSNSFLVAYLPTGSAMINFSGGYALGPNNANGARVQALLQRYGARVRVLITGARIYADGEGRSPILADIDAPLERFGLRANPDDCATIAVHGLPPVPEIAVGHQATPTLSPDTTLLVSCRVLRDSGDLRAALARERAVDLVLDRLEDACASLFHPHRLQTEHTGGRWQRYYQPTDLIAWVSDGQVKFRDLLRGNGEAVHLGSESDWAKAPQPLLCERRGGHYFARAVDARQEASTHP
jgi:hypothetical protein